MVPNFTVVLTHDVDNITDKNPYIVMHRLLKALKLLGRGKLTECIKQLIFLIKRLFSRENPYWNFEKYMNLEETYGFKSSFYFMTGDKGRYGARYKPGKVAKVLKLLDSNGWEVGLHTNFFSYNNVKKIKAEKAAIESMIGHEVIGCRNHYLRFEVPDTWRKLKEAGLKYDTTLGFPDSAGFRAGTAYPFYPYDPEKNEIIDILEIPMVIMDGAISAGSIEKVDKAWKEVKSILEWTKEVNGTIAVNFHSEVLYQEEFTLWGDIYIKILEYIRVNGGRGVTAKQVYEETIFRHGQQTRQVNRLWQPRINIGNSAGLTLPSRYSPVTGGWILLAARETGMSLL